jgi:hypothetical protein
MTLSSSASDSWLDVSTTVSALVAVVAAQDAALEAEELEDANEQEQKETKKRGQDDHEDVPPVDKEEEERSTTHERYLEALPGPQQELDDASWEQAREEICRRNLGVG